MIDSIYGMTPINKAAANVTNQAGCTTELTGEQLRDNLVSKLKSLVSEASALPKKSTERNKINKKITETNKAISEIRPKAKCKGVEVFFISVARENLSKFEFNRWMTVASDRFRASQNNESS